MIKMYHYVYQITNNNPTDLRKFYIGVRSSNVSPEMDVDYMSSSVILRECIQLSPESFSKTILSTWKTREEALLEEIRLHNLYNVSKNEEYYNLVKQTVTKFDSSGEENYFYGKHLSGEKNGFYGKRHSDKTKKHLSSIRKGTRLGEENTFFGKTHTPKTKKKIGETGWNGESGKKRRQRISKSMMGLKHNKRTCPHCGKVGAGPNMTRYHFANCQRGV